MGWEAEKKWSDRFLPEIKSIVGQVLMSEPPVEEDQKRCTDLVVLKMDSVRIACRIRRFQYAQRYGTQFTIRSKLKSQQDTELHKIVSGWGDYIFYGFADENARFLHRWFIGDLTVFRRWYLGALQKYSLDFIPAYDPNGKNDFQGPGDHRWNEDKTTRLTAFNIADLPADFVLSSNIDPSVRSFTTQESLA